MHSSFEEIYYEHMLNRIQFAKCVVYLKLFKNDTKQRVQKKNKNGNF